MANKKCAKCQETKTLDQFYKNHHPKYKYDDYDYYCKYCRNGSHLLSMRNQTKTCSLEECDLSHYAKGLCRMHYARKGRTGSVERKIEVIRPDTLEKIDKREWYLKRTYKIDLETFTKRSANGCEICGDKPDRNLQMDHDHNCCSKQITCGKCVRGVVCGKCNIAIGKMENGLIRADYPQYDNIKTYLESYNV